jgi:sugar lactone lactonase YvrE
VLTGVARKSVIILIAAFLIEVWLVHAQQTPLRGSYIIETLSPDIDPQSIAVGPAGEIYVGSRDRIYRSDDGKTFIAIAGLRHPPEFCCVDPAPPRPTFFSGDGGPALQAYIDGPNGIVVDSDGTIYFTDFLNCRVRRISPNGTIDTVVGRKGFGGDGRRGEDGGSGLAVRAQLFGPQSLVVNGSGNVFFTDTLRIRRISSDGTISTIGGNGNVGDIASLPGDVKMATDVPIFSNAIAIAPNGRLYINDRSRLRVLIPKGQK